MGSTARVTLSGPNRLVSIRARKMLRTDLFAEPGVEVAGVVDEHVDASESFHGNSDGRFGVSGFCDVELDGQQVLVLAKG